MKLIAFWSITAVLAALALAVVLPPVLGRRGRTTAPAMDEINAAIYKERLKELENEVALGALDGTDLEQAKLELERELLASMAPSNTAQVSDGLPLRRVALAVAVLLPLLAVGLYTQLGTPEAINMEMPIPSDTLSEAAQGGEFDRPALERMVASFAERLAENPGEGDNWLVLGRAYVMLENYEKAVLAFTHAHMLLGDTPDVLVEFAEAEALSNQNRFTDSASGRIDKALKLDPDHEKALWLGAFAAAQQGNPELAVSRWRRVLERETDLPRRHLIEGLIAQTRGVGAAPPEPAPTATPNAARVRVEVDLAAPLRAGLSGSETVFVFARAAEGTRVPLAVYRTRVDALPARVTLDDSMSMAPAFKLSAHRYITVIARVSMSGNAQAQSGDLEGESGPVPVGRDSPVEVSIDRRVP